eukprot:11602565-Ditylum_brightwellii.AAC.1
MRQKRNTKTDKLGHQDIRKYATGLLTTKLIKTKPTSSTITEYYSTQGRPPDTLLPVSRAQTQAKLQDFFTPTKNT